MYAIASDLHRNNISNAEEAKTRLTKYEGRKSSKQEEPNYDDSNNPKIDRDKLNEILSRRNQNG